MSRQGEALNLLKKVDAHSEQVALRVYTVSSVADDAKLGELLYRQVFGDPVPWPELDADHVDEVLLAVCETKRTSVASAFAKRVKGQADEGRAQGSNPCGGVVRAAALRGSVLSGVFFWGGRGGEGRGWLVEEGSWNILIQWAPGSTGF